MRKTELWFGICGGASGVLIGALSLWGVLPYASEMDKLYAYLCMAAGAMSIIGALLVPSHHVAGSVIMAAGLVAVTIFGFPWQSVTAVLLIISATLSLAPVREPLH